MLHVTMCCLSLSGLSPSPVLFNPLELFLGIASSENVSFIFDLVALMIFYCLCDYMINGCLLDFYSLRTDHMLIVLILVSLLLSV